MSVGERGQADLAREVWKRLRRGKALDSLGLGEHEGRVDLRGLEVPAVAPTGRVYRVERLQAYEVDDATWLKDVRLEGLDFSRASLVKLKFERSEIVNCCFDEADCAAWGLWDTEITNTSFRDARLRDASLGAPPQRRRFRKGPGMVYTRVDLARADLRGSSATEARFVDCDFSYANLRQFDFGQSFLTRCRFAGDLDEVEFAAAGPLDKPPVETLVDVDFSAAKLKLPCFRRLNLNRVRLPAGDDHLIVEHYPCVVEKAIAELEGTQDPAQLGLLGLLEFDRRWIGPHRQIGIFHLSELDDPDAAIALLRRLEANCAEPRRRR